MGKDREACRGTEMWKGWKCGSPHLPVLKCEWGCPPLSAGGSLPLLQHVRSLSSSVCSIICKEYANLTQHWENNSMNSYQTLVGFVAWIRSYFKMRQFLVIIMYVKYLIASNWINSATNNCVFYYWFLKKCLSFSGLCCRNKRFKSAVLMINLTINTSHSW